jgi:hypothetical protein
MKRLNILAVIACVGLLFAHAAVFGAGPEGGINVNVINTPLPVTGDVNATVSGAVTANVSGDVNVTNDELEVFITNDGSNPVPVTVNDGIACTGSSVYQFVGFTKASTNGAAGGYRQMLRLCQDEFGSSSRMCTDIEVFQSPQITAEPPDDVSANGWVSMSGLTPVWYPKTEQILLVSFDGRLQMFWGDIADCSRWTSGSVILPGRTFTWATGLLGTYPCSNDFSVACCKPAASTP